MLIKPGYDTFLDVELMCIFLNAVSFSRINHHLRFHSHVFQTGIEFISLADGYTPIVDSMYQEGRSTAVSDKRNNRMRVNNCWIKLAGLITGPA